MDGAPTTPAMDPVHLADLASDDCDYNDLIYLTPLELLQPLVPAGYSPRPLFTDATGAIVINAFDCRDGFAWSGWDLFVIVQAPTLPDVIESFEAKDRVPRSDDEGTLNLDLYSLAAHTDHAALRGLFEEAGMPVGPGAPSRMHTQDEATASTTATGELTAGGQVLGRYVLAGMENDVALGGFFKAHHRQWHETGAGTFLFERYMTDEGNPLHLTQGPGTCVLDPSTEFFAIVGPRPCNLSQDIIGSIEWTGGAYFFPGVKADA